MHVRFLMALVPVLISGGLLIAAEAKADAASDAAIMTVRAMVPSMIVGNAYGFLGQKVGRGECTDLVDLVLATANAKPGNNYVWGAPVSGRIMEGDVIQFWDAQFSGPNGASWGTYPGGQHTAIVVGVSGSRVTLIHQNFPTRVVTKGDYDLGWSHTGSYIVYRPIPK